LVTAWPIVLGCDASGTVAEMGEGVSKFKVGDSVFGCTRLGLPGYGTFQEYFLMDESLTFKKPANVTPEEAATLGVGILTASLGLISGLDLSFPSPGSAPSFDEWVVVLGGSGSIGQNAVQIASLCGYKVIASCSPSKAELVKARGAEHTFDYNLPLDEQLKFINKTTGGKFCKVLDTAASPTNVTAGMAMLERTSVPGKDQIKKFASTDDWSPMEAPANSGIDVYRIRLGMIGKWGEGEEQDRVSGALASFVEPLQRLVDEGEIKPMEYTVVGTGFEGVAEAIKVADSGSQRGKKCIVGLAGA